MTDFREFKKIPRLNREIIVTEKIDGTNAAVLIEERRGQPVSDYFLEVGDFYVAAQSRTRFIKRGDDNFGFAGWVEDHAEELVKLGPGRHYGEWWGKGIQRGYGLNERRFSLFNVHRWSDDAIRPACCHVVPTLTRGLFSSELISTAFERLRTLGSVAAPGFMKPEGLIVYHTAGNLYFKATLCKDEEPKGLSK